MYKKPFDRKAAAAKRPFIKKNSDSKVKTPVDKKAPEENDNSFVEENLKLIGRNAVLEALKNNVPIDRIFIKKPDSDETTPARLEGTLRVIEAKAKENRIITALVTKEKLDSLCEDEDSNHQGVVAVCPAFPYFEVSDILNFAKEKGEKPFVIVLDELNDPHNLGAVIRTADACGAHGVIIPKRRACGLTAGAVRSSAGAAAYVKVARVTNIVNTLNELKKQGLWIACADFDGESLYEAPLTGALAIVIGGEGGGIGPLVKKNCDFTVKIPMKGKISSLNASVAAAVVMYEVVRRSHA